MHDPMTVAFSIRRPWPDKKPTIGSYRYYPAIFTIWHVDPETDGSDDSCDWFYHNVTDMERRAALALLTNDIDNLNIFFRGVEDDRDKETIMIAQWRSARRYYRPRAWYRHPRWHIWHWKIQWHFGQALARYLFSRCAKCGGRFPWGYAPIGPWSGGGPRFFRGESGVYHHECDRSSRPIAE